MGNNIGGCHAPPANPCDTRLTCTLVNGRSRFALTMKTPIARGSGTGNYEDLINKPRLNGVELVGDVSLEDIGLGDVPRVPLSIYDIDMITDNASTEESFIELCSYGGDISLFNDITLTHPMTIYNDLTIDLRGNTIYSELSEYLFTVDSCVLTIKGGNITTEGNLATVVNGGGIIIDDGTYIAKNVVFSAPEDDCSITINNGTIKSLNSFSIYSSRVSSGNTIVLNGGHLESSTITNNFESCCVYIAGNDEFTMNGGVVESIDGCGILMRAGTVVINDGEVTAKKKGSDSHSPGYVEQMNKQMSASAVIYDEASDFPSKDGMSLTIHNGTFTGVDHSLEILSNEVEPAVIVTGGTFVPDYD